MAVPSAACGATSCGKGLSVGIPPVGEGSSHELVIESARHRIASSSPEGSPGSRTLKHKVVQISSTGAARKKKVLLSRNPDGFPLGKSSRGFKS